MGPRAERTELTVGAGFAGGLLAFAVSKGAARETLLASSGIDPAALQSHDSRIPFSRYVALMRAAKALTGDPALALHFAEAVDITNVSIVGLIGLASETVAEAFQQLNRFVRLVVETENAGSGGRFQLVRDGRGLWVVDARKHANDFPELTESAVTQIICSARRHGAQANLKAVHFTHPDPGYRAEYERIYGVPVVFDSDWNALAVEEGVLADPIRALPRYAFDVLTERAEALLAQLESAGTVRGRVEALLGPALHAGQASMEAVAREMSMSRQTLFRKLRAEGVTFEQVLDELRHGLALRYLAGSGSVNETAYLLGFSDPTAFSRAFKRWTGVSPRGARGLQTQRSG